MATNVTQKDKTLNEIIDWCEQLEVEGLRLANTLLMQRDMAAYGVVKGQINAYEKTADHCRSLLGYSGTMPSEVPNQSEDTEMTIDELHDYCRYLLEHNNKYGCSGDYSDGYNFALSHIMFKCHAGLSEQNRRAIADWRENHWKDAK